MKLYEPGPNFSDGDNWNEHPLGVDAPRHRLGQDDRQLDSRE